MTLGMVVEFWGKGAPERGLVPLSLLIRLSLYDALVQDLYRGPALCQAMAWEQRGRQTKSDPYLAWRDKRHQGVQLLGATTRQGPNSSPEFQEFRGKRVLEAEMGRQCLLKPSAFSGFFSNLLQGFLTGFKLVMLQCIAADSHASCFFCGSMAPSSVFLLAYVPEFSFLESGTF